MTWLVLVAWVPSTLGRWIVLALCFTLSGCVGYTGSSFEWLVVDTPSDTKTKDGVLERFGSPLRVTQEQEFDVWHFLVGRDVIVAGRILPVERRSTLGLVLVPIFWTTRAPENVRITLRGDDVVQVEILKKTAYGAFCGLIASDGWPGCVSE